MAALDWIDKNKENSDIGVLDAKINEVDAEIKPIIAKIHEEAPNLPPTAREKKESRAVITPK